MNRWKRANRAYEHYQSYIKCKYDRYSLSFIDFIFVKNFKGGNSIIAEPIETFYSKANIYEKALRNFSEGPVLNNTLSSMSEAEFEVVKKKIVNFASISEDEDARISGFGASFASALLHFYFPLVVPILDRRVLNGSGIDGVKIQKGVVSNFLDLYPELIVNFRKRLLDNRGITLRELDLELFQKKLKG